MAPDLVPLMCVPSASILSSGFLHIQQLYHGDDEELGRAMGTVTTGIITGVIVGPPIGGILYEIDSALPFYTVAVIICACTGGATVLPLKALINPPSYLIVGHHCYFSGVHLTLSSAPNQSRVGE